MDDGSLTQLVEKIMMLQEARRAAALARCREPYEIYGITVDFSRAELPLDEWFLTAPGLFDQHGKGNLLEFPGEPGLPRRGSANECSKGRRRLLAGDHLTLGSASFGYVGDSTTPTVDRDRAVCEILIHRQGEILAAGENFLLQRWGSLQAESSSSGLGAFSALLRRNLGAASLRPSSPFTLAMGDRSDRELLVQEADEILTIKDELSSASCEKTLTELVDKAAYFGYATARAENQELGLISEKEFRRGLQSLAGQGRGEKLRAIRETWVKTAKPLILRFAPRFKTPTRLSTVAYAEWSAKNLAPEPPEPSTIRALIMEMMGEGLVLGG